MTAPPPSRSPLPRLLALAWAYRRRCLSILAVQVALLALGVVGLGISGLAIDVLRATLQPGAPAPRWPLGWTPPANWSALALVAAGGASVLLLAVVRAGLTYVYGLWVGRLVQYEIVPTLRAAVFAKLQRMSFRFFDATASGSIINRVTGDVQSVRAFVDQVIIQSLVILLALAVALTYMLGKHVGLTLACLASTPLLWFATVRFSRWVAPSYDESRRLLDGLVTTVGETISGMSVIKGFAREEDRRALFDARNRRVQEQQGSIFRRVSRFTPVVDGLSQANLLVLLAYGGSLVVAGRMSLGELLVFAGLLQQYGTQVAGLANVINTLQQSLISARRVFEILDAPVEVQDAPGVSATAESPRLDGHVAFHRVSFGYQKDEPALRDIDFTVQPGQRVVLFGETGSGKSTLLSLVPRFYDATAGQVVLSGRDVRELPLASLRAQVGIVFQESFLFATTVRDNIAFGRPGASIAAVERAARLASAHDFVMRMRDGYETILEEGGANLSGGQRQRLALARAILLDPPVLLLDDPTAAVDSETETEMLGALRVVTAGRTTFLATHRIAAARDADLILVLEDGRIVERGTHAELLRAGGPYQAVAELQAHGGDDSWQALGAS